MSRLYSVLSKEDDSTDSIASSPLDNSTENVTEMLDIMSASMDSGEQIVTTAIEQACLGEKMEESLKSLPLGTKEYYASLETYRNVVEVFGKRMGVTTLPAMEDFKNEYALRSSHQLALEGFKDFIKKAWESVKRFFKDFFKKVMLFFKRILRANLDLESYEKYNDQLVAKLKANNAVNKDNTPINTKLGQLLADKGQETVDSDYILKFGMPKVDRLVRLISIIRDGKSGAMNKDFLNSFKTSLQKMVTSFKDIDLGTVEEDIVTGYSSHFKVDSEEALMTLFRFPIPDVRSLPDDVYQNLLDGVSTSDLTKEGFTLSSLADVSRPTGILPKDFNIYVASIDKEKYFVATHKEDTTITSLQVKPVQELNNLVTLHSTYKKEIQTLNLKDITKTIDKMDSEISDILDILSGRWVEIVNSDEETGQSIKARYEETFNVLKEKLKTSSYWDQSLARVKGELFEYTNGKQEVNEILMGWISEMFERDCRNLYDRYKDFPLKTRIEALVEIHKLFELPIPNDLSRINDSDSELAKKNYKTLQTLNQFLMHVFNKLQAVLRGITVDLFSLFTEIRYELVRYIYESARKYSY